MTRSDFQPLLDKISARFNSWTVKHLSFAGRFQLIQAVIYSTISFWASMFIIPNECIRILERMCNAFLWNGAPNSARGARIAWESVCTPKEAGGLGLKRLADWNVVLGLKLIWLLFAAGGVIVGFLGEKEFDRCGKFLDVRTSEEWKLDLEIIVQIETYSETLYSLQSGFRDYSEVLVG